MKDNYQIAIADAPVEKSPIETFLTIEKLKQYKGLENVTDEEALNIIHSVVALCKITIEANLHLLEAA